MKRHEIIDRCVRDLRQIMVSNRRKVSPCSSVLVDVPGLLTKWEIDGHKVADLIVPVTQIPPDHREQALWDIMSIIHNENATPGIIRSSGTELSTQVLTFAMTEPTMGGRLAKLLWVMGADTGRELGKGTVLVQTRRGEYGIKDNKVVGGNAHGFPLAVDTDALFTESRQVRERSRGILALRDLQFGARAEEATKLFGTLYAMSAWDASIPIHSILIPRNPAILKKIEALSQRLMEAEDPYRTLYRSLVPYQMTSIDFRKVFGRHTSRGNLKSAARHALVAKLQSLSILK